MFENHWTAGHLDLLFLNQLLAWAEDISSRVAHYIAGVFDPTIQDGRSKTHHQCMYIYIQLAEIIHIYIYMSQYLKKKKVFEADMSSFLWFVYGQKELRWGSTSSWTPYNLKSCKKKCLGPNGTNHSWSWNGEGRGHGNLRFSFPQRANILKSNSQVRQKQMQHLARALWFFRPVRCLKDRAVCVMATALSGTQQGMSGLGVLLPFVARIEWHFACASVINCFQTS